MLLSLLKIPSQLLYLGLLHADGVLLVVFKLGNNMLDPGRP